MSALPGPGIVGGVACTLGLAGLVAVVMAFSRRRSAMAILLMVVYSILTVGGGLMLRASEATLPWGTVLAAIAAAGACVGCALMVRRDGELSQSAEDAENALAGARREIEALLGGKRDLETQLTSSRKRLSEMLERADGTLATPERIEGYRERIRRLRASEEKLRQVIDHTRDGIVMLENETLRLTRFTPSAARMTGHTPEALSELTILDLLDKGPSEPDRAALQRIAHEGRSLSAKLVRADGDRLPVEISVSPVGKDDDAQLMVLLRDESEEARLRGELDSLRNELVERDRRLTDAERDHAADSGRRAVLESELQSLESAQALEIDAVAHDLRVPLTSVRSFSEILLEHEDTDPHVRREFLDIIRKESERLTSMIDELLDMRRIRAGAAELAMTELDLRDLLGDTLDTLEGLAQEHGITFEGVWSRESHVVRGDSKRLHRMIVNLLSNAVKFSTEGGAVEIILRQGSQPGSTLLGIRDHGPGIAEEDQEIVFERFHRASTGPDRAPGTGLGLSICREIASAHGARMWPESRGGGGTTLWVEFPPSDAPGSDADVAPEIDAGVTTT